MSEDMRFDCAPANGGFAVGSKLGTVRIADEQLATMTYNLILSHYYAGLNQGRAEVRNPILEALGLPEAE